MKNFLNAILPNIILLNMILVTFTFFTSCAALATSVVSSQFEMILPRPFQRDVINDLWQRLQKEEFRLNWSIADQTYQAPDVNVLLSGVTLEMKTKLQRPTVGDAGPTLILNSRDLSASLKIAALVVDQYIEREIGGVIGRFRVQARCENVRLDMKKNAGSFRVLLSPVFAGALVKSQLDDVDLTWTPDAWTLGPLTCTGAAGFEQIVREEILKLTGNADKLTEQKSSLISYVQAELDKRFVDLSKPRLLSQSRPDIFASMQIDSFAGGPESARAMGTLRVEFQNSASNRNLNFVLGPVQLNCADCKKAQVRVPEAFAMALAEESLAAGSWSKRFLGEEIPGFATLMKSRVGQLLYWPELLRYLVGDPFRFEVTTGQDLKIRGQKLNYLAKTSLKIKMWAFENQKFIPFMRFEVPVESRIQLAVQDGVALAQFAETFIVIRHHWEESYLRDRNSTEKFAAEKIAARASRGLEENSVSYVLPQIELSAGLILKFVDLKNQSGSGDVILSLR